MSSPFQMSDDTPVYVISVAAELSGMHPQTLRSYDRQGLVSPGRSAGQGRRYSLRDILLLREIQRLSQEEGVNLSGVKRILELEQQLGQFRALVAQLSAELEQVRTELESTRAVAARLAGLLRAHGTSTALVPVRNRGSATGPPASGPEPPTDGPRQNLPAADTG
jgi:MerR family transcriptional regulator, heat shock protein HspR